MSDLAKVLRAMAQSPESCIQALAEDGSCIEYLRRAADAIDALNELVRAVGQLPENARGTINGEDLNIAYSRACKLTGWCSTCNNTGYVRDSEIPYVGNQCPDCE
jgi:hypothetical protein